MARGKTLRHLSDEQFADGTSISGARIDRAMDDFVKRLNRVRPGDVKTRFVRNKIVLGFQPQVYDANDTAGANKLDHHYPFLRVRNGADGVNDQIVVEEIETYPGAQNEWRKKGIRIPNLTDDGSDIDDLIADTDSVSQWAWTTSVQLDDESILDGVFLLLATDSCQTVDAVYSNTWQYDATRTDPIHGRGTGDWIDDLMVIVDVDNPFATEDRRANDVEFSKWSFNAGAYRISNAGVPAAAGYGSDAIEQAPWNGTDMDPVHPGGVLDGICIWKPDLNIPLRAGARVRISVVFPMWGTDYDAGWNEHPVYGPASHPLFSLQNQAPNLCVTFLEPLTGTNAGDDTAVTRKRVARGTTITPDHIAAVPTMRSALTNRLPAAQIERNQAPFRVNVWLPFMGANYAARHAATGEVLGWAMAFPLTPLQDFFDGSSMGQPDADTPLVELTSVSFSLDQRGEPCALSDRWWGGAPVLGSGWDLSNCGKLSRAQVDRYNFRFVIWEKRSRFWEGLPMAISANNEEHRVQTEVFSLDLPSTFFSGDDLRLNPYVRTNIGKVLNPYSTYVAGIIADDLFDPTADNYHLAIVNVLASCKFRHVLVAPDEGDYVQNFPQAFNSPLSGPTFTAATPSPGDNLQADQASGKGVSDSLEPIDETFRHRLRGGYTRFGGQEAGPEIGDDAAYEIISIPMWGAQPEGTFDGNNADRYPYAIGGDPTCDRRIFPIDGAMTIHHVIACFNWQSAWTSSDGRTGDDEVQIEIGLGIRPGPGSDTIAYTEIAHLLLNYSEAVPALLPTAYGDYRDYLIDRVGRPFADGPRWPELDLVSVPIVRTGVSDGVGYVSQGHPFYVGPGAAGFGSNRSSCGSKAHTPAVVVPATAGNEMLLEARWRFLDASLGGWVNGVYAGYGGCVLYLICKKHLV